MYLYLKVRLGRCMLFVMLSPPPETFSNKPRWGDVGGPWQLQILWIEGTKLILPNWFQKVNNHNLCYSVPHNRVSSPIWHNSKRSTLTTPPPLSVETSAWHKSVSHPTRKSGSGCNKNICVNIPSGQGWNLPNWSNWSLIYHAAPPPLLVSCHFHVWPNQT
jgi:hypothetical protein